MSVPLRERDLLRGGQRRCACAFEKERDLSRGGQRMFACAFVFACRRKQRKGSWKEAGRGNIAGKGRERVGFVVEGERDSKRENVCELIMRGR